MASHQTMKHARNIVVGEETFAWLPLEDGLMLSRLGIKEFQAELV